MLLHHSCLKVTEFRIWNSRLQEKYSKRQEAEVYKARALKLLQHHICHIVVTESAEIQREETYTLPRNRRESNNHYHFKSIIHQIIECLLSSHIFKWTSRDIAKIFIDEMIWCWDIRKSGSGSFQYDGSVGKCSTWILLQPHRNYK